VEFDCLVVMIAALYLIYINTLIKKLLKIFDCVMFIASITTSIL